ncbi:hypothetical protein M5689_008651 [Euphorbia peplus]|nr:hypothetical protein M5689_008651 [Euphorbia peplus]
MPILRVEECYHGSSSSQRDLINLLTDHGPFVGGVLHTTQIETFTFDPSRNFVSVPDYIYSASGPPVLETLPNGSTTDHHAFMVTGYGEVYDSNDLLIGRYWRAQNNWGSDFDDERYFRIWMEVPMSILGFESFILLPPPKNDIMEDIMEE